MAIDIDIRKPSQNGLNVLTVGPMCTHPPMVGDAKRNHRIARAMVNLGINNVYVGKNFIYYNDTHVEFPAGNLVSEENKSLTALRALTQWGHYNEVKHCTASWLRFASPYLRRDEFDAIYCHFVYVYPCIAGYIKERPLVIDTHNSEWQWFDRFSDSSRSPLVKMLCNSSNRRADKIMAMLPPKTIMVHVSDADLEDYKARRPDLTHLLVPQGCDMVPRTTCPDYRDERKTLLFFASLHGKMSLDALLHFGEAFWPELKESTRLIVAGARPIQQICDLCRKYGWELRPNLSDEEVTQTYSETHFAILPFTYGVGSKHKLLDACSRGVPVLTTKAGACGQIGMPRFVHVTDSPAEWRQILATTRVLPSDWREEVFRYGNAFSWEGLIAEVVERMANAVNSRLTIPVGKSVGNRSQQ